MAIPLKEYKEIFAQTPKHGKGDVADPSEEDEKALDRAWAKLIKRRKEADARLGNKTKFSGEKL